MSAEHRLAIALALTAVLSGCGDDDGTVVPDAGPDAENLCPGAFTFEAFVGDLESDAAVFDVSVAEADDDANATTSAPNGRAVLCLPDGGADVRASKADTLNRRDVLDAGAMARVAGAGQPYPLHVATTAAIDALYADLSVTRDEGATQLVVAVRSYPDGVPLEGAEVTVGAAGDGAFARDGAGAFAPAAGGAVAGGGLVLFANTGGGETTITVTPPGDFDGTCEGPASASLEVGGVTGVLFACQ